MPGLTYSDGEVQQFHPAFKAAADEALEVEGLTDQLCWEHHLRTPGCPLVPDFVLIDRSSRRWKLAVEIKRRKASVYGLRNQLQAKSYAELHDDLYTASRPRYFSLSNLEQTILFALRDSLPPNECRLRDGIYSIGTLNSLGPTELHNGLVETLRSVTSRVLDETFPEFDEVWPTVLRNFVVFSDRIVSAPTMGVPETLNWDIVQTYFSSQSSVENARILLLRCLLVEYITGVLERFQHPRSRELLHLASCVPGEVCRSIANTISRLRNIDFHSLFESGLPDLYRNIRDRQLRTVLAEYVQSLVTPPCSIGVLARTRLDRDELLNGIINETHGERLDDKGKVPTDPELAALLAHLTIQTPTQIVIDPGCGDGILLEAAYDRLADLGGSHDDILNCLKGIDVDPILTHLCTLRLLLKDPAAVRDSSLAHVIHGDMFCHANDIGTSDVILMNPPFRRYEAQDENPVPDDLKLHYSNAIRHITGEQPIAVEGQQNFFTYYLEYIIATAKNDCRIAVILDNKWYHNKYSIPLKKLLLENSIIEAIIEYPRLNLFSDWTIATSVLVLTKTTRVPANHQVRFVRSRVDLSQIDVTEIPDHFPNNIADMPGWTCREVSQSSLDHRLGWKGYFEKPLNYDYTSWIPLLTNLFSWCRRGSLAKEEGGVSALSFPFSRRDFGYLRRETEPPKRPYQADRIRKLTNEENRELRTLADNCSDGFRGYAVERADTLNSYVLTENQLLRQPTLEPPSLRGLEMFWSDSRTEWTDRHKAAIEEIQQDAATNEFIIRFRELTGLNETFMPNKWLFVGLKEPYAGELILPRKMRGGHRVHVNLFACLGGDRQIRLSSNFITLGGCRTYDETSDLNKQDAVKIIAAFLVSSFGQLQFEMAGYNREGLLSVELHHLEKIHCLDPQCLEPDERNAILSAFSHLPYPVATDHLSSDAPERNHLDAVIASTLCRLEPVASEEDLLADVHRALDEYLVARLP